LLLCANFFSYTISSLVNPGVEVDIGANASAEEAEEDLADDAIQINDVVHSFRLQATEFDKKSYMTYIKGIYN
jgi:hypothetical protein